MKVMTPLTIMAAAVLALAGCASSATEPPESAADSSILAAYGLAGMGLFAMNVGGQPRHVIEGDG